MAKEKMAELKIKIPARWLNFINEYHEVAGRDLDENMRDTIKAAIESWMIPELSAKDTIRLVEKHNLSDIYEIPQWDRDEAAGIPRKVPTANNTKREAVHQLMNNPKFKESFKKHLDDAEVDSFIAAMDVLSPEEMATVKAGILSA